MTQLLCCYKLIDFEFSIFVYFLLDQPNYSFLNLVYLCLVLCSNRTPLHLSAESGHVEMCRLLVSLKADINATNLRYQGPLVQSNL
jgi:hypothetical protein